MISCSPYNLFCNFVSWLSLTLPPLLVFIVAFILGRRIGRIIPNALLRWVFFFLALSLSCALSASWWRGLDSIDLQNVNILEKMSIGVGWFVQMAIGGISFGVLFGGRSKVNLRKATVEESRGKEKEKEKEKGGESKKVEKVKEKDEENEEDQEGDDEEEEENEEK